MPGIKELDVLLGSIKPELSPEEFVFCTLSNVAFSKLKIKPLLIFHEKEGVTLIISKKLADKESLNYSGVWSMITLTVHSDLSSVGFLAAISRKLADNNISVNVVSAYCHDHLFVPAEEAKKAVQLLIELSYSR
ncbi:ACT domain-containing protein [Candidatus Woesearchaeota archaeon]|nr:ACT domain-containing protein [Candidatus Woesearchaeota archaeon]